MHQEPKRVLLVAMPFAGVAIPSIQLPVLEGYCTERNIPIQTKHLYLKAAEIYGLHNYNMLIYQPNDSYTAQMIFSKYVFPDHWTQNQEKFHEYYDNHIVNTPEEQQRFPFQKYVELTDVFYQWTLDHVDWKSYDLIGFTLNYGQFLPSLAIAKKIKEQWPEKQIILGGSRTIDELGINTLRAFPYIDYIVSGDGEDSLYRLAQNTEDYETIPRLMYRKEDEIIWNQTEEVVNINSLPIPSYDPFFKELAESTPEIQQFFQYYGRLPVEVTRGCWWNKCSFCNLNKQHHHYREKHVNRIIEEIIWLSNRYKILNFQIIGNTIPKTAYRELCEKLKTLGNDYSFAAETRADQLQKDDYTLLKDAGFTTIQTGVESFSPHYLKKMNKGTRVIQNIATLKFCKENHITNQYNLLVNYPNEDAIDYGETLKTVALIQSYLDPPQLCHLRVLYGSPIQQHPDQFNINHLTTAPIDHLMYPPEILEKQLNFVFSYEQREPTPKLDWNRLIDDWRKLREKLETNALRTKSPIDEHIFYFVDGTTFLKIYDKRDPENIHIYILDPTERVVFLTCIDVISFSDLQEQHPDIPDYQLAAILHSFEKNGIIYQEDDLYLSLPLRYNLTNPHPIQNIQQCTLNQVEQR
ncbi:MAG: RiPP maturation radical SAM C-methyltransferase [Methanobacteriota archaeon]